MVVPGYMNKGIDWVNAKANLGVPRLPEKNFNLGLDLQGGVHLIYEANTTQIADKDKAGAVEGVRDVIERRVRGGLGVSEPLVQTTRVGNSYRIIVELPGVNDVSQAIKMIGDTPVLEFKEENNTAPRDLTAEEKKQLADFNLAAQVKAGSVLKDLLANKITFEDAVKTFSEDEQSKNNGGDLGFITAEQYPEIYAWAKTHQNGDISRELVKSADGFNIVKRLAEKDGEVSVGAAHLLICFIGSENCDNPKYSREQALAKIQEIKKQATPQNFADLVKQYSTEPGAGDRGGDLGIFKKGQMVPEFDQVVFNMPVGTISDVVETKFGFHLIYKKSEDKPKEYQVARIFIRGKQATDIVPPVEAWKTTGLSGKQLKRAEVTENTQTGQIQVALNFDADGTKLFADITQRNVGKPVAIFLDGQPISVPRVNEPILNGSAVITGGFTMQEAQQLAQRLNAGALPVPVEMLSQEKVDATLGVDSLNKSFKAGLVGLLLVMIFMVIYYRLPGLLSVFSLLMYAVLSMTIFKLIGVTLTLAGIAGFIMSIGMAVDANVLVFERLKEELRFGKNLTSAMEESFLRAWPSIWDSHMTTFISCLMLVWFGSGFIQGFATVLALGIIVNLFTAYTVTRTIMRLVFTWFKGGANHLFLGFTKNPVVPTEIKR